MASLRQMQVNKSHRCEHIHQRVVSIRRDGSDAEVLGGIVNILDEIIAHTETSSNFREISGVEVATALELLNVKSVIPGGSRQNREQTLS
jgi:hypothetical protein